MEGIVIHFDDWNIPVLYKKNKTAEKLSICV
jgi:hypothetical protein